MNEIKIYFVCIKHNENCKIFNIIVKYIIDNINNKKEYDLLKIIQELLDIENYLNNLYNLID